MVEQILGRRFFLEKKLQIWGGKIAEESHQHSWAGFFADHVRNRWCPLGLKISDNIAINRQKRLQFVRPYLYVAISSVSGLDGVDVRKYAQNSKNLSCGYSIGRP
jgi:hypothetical protein